MGRERGEGERGEGERGRVRGGERGGTGSVVTYRLFYYPQPPHSCHQT